MPTTFASLGLGNLSTEEKLELIGQLWDDFITSLPPGNGLSDAQREELNRRQQEAAAKPEEWVAWEDALKASLLPREVDRPQAKR